MSDRSARRRPGHPRLARARAHWSRHRAPAGSKGNKTEQPAPLAVSVLLAVPGAAFLAYYLRFQTFVWAAETPAGGGGARLRSRRPLGG
jgi:hypothetical protein